MSDAVTTTMRELCTGDLDIEIEEFPMPPPMPDDHKWTGNELQQDQEAWCLHNFGPHPSMWPLLGIVEELGELAAAAVTTNKEQVRDAIADIVIFAADYCTQKGWKLEDVVPTYELVYSTAGWGERELREMQIHIGEAAHHELKATQGIRGTPAEHSEKGKIAMLQLFGELRVMAKAYFGRDILDIASEEWNAVRRRDFRIFPKNGKTE